MSISFHHIALVALGGMSGSVLRYLTGLLLYAKSTPAFPWATFGVNVLGSLLMGLVAGFAARHQTFQSWYLLLATGFCGGFTTFSALSYESISMLRNQQWGALALYLSATLILGIGAAALGYSLTK
jgi:CrcB protein